MSRQHFSKPEKTLAALNRWREAGKQVGRKLGIVEERKRILAIIDIEIAEATERGAILRANYLMELRYKIRKEY